MGFTGKDVHVDVPLSNVAIAYRPQNLIAEEICPIVSVPKQSDATSRHSRRACSKAADNRESSRSTELPVTSRERWSRHAPMCSGVMCPTGRWMGSAA